MLLCMTTRFENNEVFVDYEKLPLDVKAGVEFLRRQPGIGKVLLFGHSGGGPLMSLYQAVAEKGVAYCKGANKLVELFLATTPASLASRLLMSIIGAPVSKISLYGPLSLIFTLTRK